MNNQIYNLALSIARGIGPINSARIMDTVETAEEFFNMSVDERIDAFEKVPKHILDDDYSEAISMAEKEIQWCEKNGVSLVSFVDDNYPRRLMHIPDKPIVLFNRGICDLNAMRTVAIVGTRKATEYGKIFVDQLVQELKQYDVHIISGMAYGIDAAAHQAALKYGIPTIGILGHGLDRTYPPKHKKLGQEIIHEKGALLSEFAHGTDPEREHFPMRNRIIAGMSDVVIIIESNETGGSMITADLANTYNKDVFALPGRYNDNRSRGCNLLVKSQRAHLLESAEDIKYIMRWEKREGKHDVQPQLFKNLTDAQKDLLHTLKHHKKLHIDEISAKMKLTTSKVSGILLTLELEGLVKCLPGNCYIAI